MRKIHVHTRKGHGHNLGQKGKKETFCVCKGPNFSIVKNLNVSHDRPIPFGAFITWMCLILLIYG